ncbi:MAG: glycosyltransferase family 2 protein [Deltaproteobacteria bacterium]|nr:glycosyltransferase family 2 protein [Deltaproteobacteria bacterium]
MALPLVSCIVPVFNGERYLEEALDSILAQNYRPIEIIVVNDGSTDGTARILAGMQGAIRTLQLDNRGPSATRNLGWQAAAGEFVAFLDQDDLWHADKLARQMARFDARPNLDLCIAHAQPFWVDELREEAARLRDHPRAKAVPGYTTGALLAKKKVFERYGGFDDSLWFGDATEWFLRLADRGAIMELMPDVLLYHRMHPANHTRRRTNASKEEFLQIIKTMLDRKRLRDGSVVPYRWPKLDSESDRSGKL